METTSLTILEAIEHIHSVSKNSKLNIDKFFEARNQIKKVSTYFGISQIEAILLSSFITLGCLEQIKLNNIIYYFKMKQHEFLKYTNDLDTLVAKNILIEIKFPNSTEYKITPHILKFIAINQAIPEELLTIKVKENTFQEFLGDLDKLSNQKDDKEIEYSYFFYQFRQLLDQNKHFKLIDYVLQNKLDWTDCFVFFDVIIDGMSKGENNFQSNLQRTVNDFTNYRRDSFRYISQFLEGKTKLNELDLIEKDKAQFGGSHNIQLTQKALNLLFEMEGIKIGYKANKNDKLTFPEAIQKRNLFYNLAEQTQLEIIAKSMSEIAFQKLQNKLKARNMTPGITALLYGAPGTGKTETVYQLAKKFNRPVFKVDIADSKSMWFGESQKLVKKIFTDYQDFKRESDICPILLLNEADAIIGKRKDAGSSSVADTENAIQNILLEELEHFDGILFATTNLVKNLDAAFERRFLFKIGFEKPSLENAAKIWKSKLRKLTQPEAEQLAQRFPFSGGEMENIARKCVMEEVVLGKKVTFEKITVFCENESWNPKNKGSRIGF